MTDLNNDFTSRTALILGEEGVLRLKNASVAVAGVGGVGSYAAEALARSGVGSITLIDHDLVHPSNINRQVHALTSTVGCPKVSIMADRLSLINSSILITPLQMMITPENVTELLAQGFDMVLDAIDTFAAKLALLANCQTSGVAVVSSMGAAGRLDPSRIMVGDISGSHGCRLARKLRKELRRAGLFSGITVVYSDEPSVTALSGNESADTDSRRSLGTVSYMPAIFGMTMAGAAIRKIIAVK